MADNTIKARIKIPVKTTENWKNTTIIPKLGELIYDSDTKILKIGNDSTSAYDLPALSAYYESYLRWGNSNIVGNISPVDAGCTDEMGHNKLAFLPASCIKVEYTTDGGTTWLDYGATNAEKTKLVTWDTQWFYAGKVGTAGIITKSNVTNYKVRVTISARTLNSDNTSNSAQPVYTSLKKTLLNVSTNGGLNCKVLFESRTIANRNNNTWNTVGTYTVAGWSGWNSLTSDFAFGGSDNQTNQIATVRFTFWSTDVNEAKPEFVNSIGIGSIRFIGLTNWNTPSNLARWGHIYDVDANQGAYFPNNIYTNNVVPKSTRVYNLGTTDSRWVNAYVDKIELNTDGNIGKSFISFWKPAFYTWKTYMSNADAGVSVTGGKPSTLGNVTTYAIRSLVTNNSNYGWIWESSANTSGVNPVARMALSSNNGQLTLAGNHIPSVTNTYSLGNNTNRWNAVWGSVIHSPYIVSTDETFKIDLPSGNGLLAVFPNGAWTGISSTQQGFGTLIAQTVLRSNSTDLLHYKANSGAYTILDTSNAFVSDVHYTTDTTKAVNAKQVWDEFEKRNVQFVPTSTVNVKSPTLSQMSEEDFINTYAYGIQWVQNAATCTRTGNTKLGEELPIQNSFRACVYKIVPQTVIVTENIDGTDYSITYGAKREFQYWLDDDNWSQTSTGKPSVLDGSDNTGIAIWHPRFFGKSFEGVKIGSSTYNRVLVSLVQYDDTWVETKEGFVDFAKMQESSIESQTRGRSFGDPDFSITNPMTSEMALADINTWIQNQKRGAGTLTKSKLSQNRLVSHRHALNSGSHLMSYDEYKWIFCWLPAIECCSFKVDSDIFTWQDGANTNIVMRDSLSTTPEYMYHGLYSANYSAISSALTWACIPAGYTNALGTHTGWVKIRLPNSSGGWDSLSVSRWRGFEIQRNIWTSLYGVNPVQPKTNNICDIYTTKNRALWSNDMPITIVDSSASTHDNIVSWTNRNTTTPEYTTKPGWNYVGTQRWSGTGQEFYLGNSGEAFVKSTGSGKADYSYGALSNSNPRWFIAGGRLNNSSNGGPFYFLSADPAASAGGSVGFRCCWNIDEYESVMN